MKYTSVSKHDRKDHLEHENCDDGKHSCSQVQEARKQVKALRGEG